MSILAANRKATFDYEILETYEAGVALHGFEVKSVRAGHINLLGSFVVIRAGEAWLTNAAIPPYQVKNTPSGYDPARSRRLLLHRAQIKELIGASAHRGLTMIPLRVYTKSSRIKLEFGLARHKKKYDKREVIRAREDQRRIERGLDE